MRSVRVDEKNRINERVNVTSFRSSTYDVRVGDEDVREEFVHVAYENLDRDWDFDVTFGEEAIEASAGSS